MSMRIHVLVSQGGRCVASETDVDDMSGALQRARPDIEDDKPFEVFVFASTSGVLVDHFIES